MRDKNARRDREARKQEHGERVLTYGEIHLHITVAIDTIRARWPGDDDEKLIARMTETARRILKMRREGKPVIITRNKMVD